MCDKHTIIRIQKLTYPTLGRGKSLQKRQNVWDVLGPCSLQRVYIILCYDMNIQPLAGSQFPLAGSHFDVFFCLICL